MFPGQYHNGETRLYYNYFRTYDPSTGRYLESDPIGLVAGLNTYAYVGNMPTMRTDRFGLYEGGGISEVMPGYTYEQYLDLMSNMEYRPPTTRTRMGVIGCIGGCASYIDGDRDTQASLSPMIGSALMFCSEKPATEESCEIESDPTPPGGCGIYDPNCDNSVEPGASISRGGFGIGYSKNPDGSSCMMIGPFVGWPVVAPTIHLGDMSE